MELAERALPGATLAEDGFRVVPLVQLSPKRDTAQGAHWLGGFLLVGELLQ